VGKQCQRHLEAARDVIHSDAFKARIEPLGMTAPAALLNRLENFAASMRAEIARQAELAKLTRHNPMEPKQ
jgi:hypothetical protein